MSEEDLGIASLEQQFGPILSDTVARKSNVEGDWVLQGATYGETVEITPVGSFLVTFSAFEGRVFFEMPRNDLDIFLKTFDISRMQIYIGSRGVFKTPEYIHFENGIEFPGDIRRGCVRKRLRFHRI